MSSGTVLHSQSLLMVQLPPMKAFLAALLACFGKSRAFSCATAGATIGAGRRLAHSSAAVQSCHSFCCASFRRIAATPMGHTSLMSSS
eukprot:6571499-Pyramimonas_sp.AAC.1